jgi:hypothetical protein
MACYGSHRRIVEKSLGRKLKKGEVVHHRDHNPKNNEIRNLEVLTEKEHNILHFRGLNALYKFRKNKNE